MDEEEGPQLEDDYVITKVFTGMYHGACVIDREHIIKPGQKVGKVKHSTNPFIPISGVCCANCVRYYPRER